MESEILNSTPPTQQASVNPINQCQDCGKIFKERRQLSYHINRTLKKREYSCDNCCQTYDSPRLLLSHISLCLKDGKPKKRRAKGYTTRKRRKIKNIEKDFAEATRVQNSNTGYRLRSANVQHCVKRKLDCEELTTDIATRIFHADKRRKTAYDDSLANVQDPTVIENSSLDDQVANSDPPESIQVLSDSECHEIPPNDVDPSDSVRDTGDTCVDVEGDHRDADDNHHYLISYKDEFVLKMWGIKGESEQIRKMMESEGDATRYEHLMKLLRGECNVFANADQMLNFLSIEPHLVVGIAPISIVLFQFVMKSSTIAEAFKLYNGLQNFGKKVPAPDPPSSLWYVMADMVLNEALLKVQQQLDREYPSDRAFEDIPAHACSENILSLLKKANNIYFNGKALAALVNLITFIQPMIILSEPKEITTTSTTDASTVDMWRLLAVELATCYKTDTHTYKQSNLFSMLLMQNLENRIGTSLYCNVKLASGKDGVDNIHVKPLHLHKEAVNHLLCQNIEQDQIVTVSASVGDMRTIIRLLYCNADDEDNKMLANGELTIGVYNIAIHIGIKDLKWFLFRKQAVCNLVDRSNKMDVLHVIIKLRYTKKLQELAPLLETLFTDEEKLQILTGLSVHDVIYFCQVCKFPGLSELCKYFMLEAWAETEASNGYGVEKFNKLTDQERHRLTSDKFKLVSDILQMDLLAIAAFGAYSQLTLIDTTRAFGQISNCMTGCNSSNISMFVGIGV